MDELKHILEGRTIIPLKMGQERGILVHRLEMWWNLALFVIA
jgi:hypothetical protein